MEANKCVCCELPIAEDRQVCEMCENGWKTNTDKAFDIQTGLEINKDTYIIRGHRMTDLESAIFHGWQDLNCGVDDEIINEVFAPFINEVAHE
jgi:hypothetical protein